MTHTWSGVARINDTVPDWAAALYAAFDALDASDVATHFADDVRFRVGNGEQITGRDGYLAAAAHFGAVLTGMRHHFRQVWECGSWTLFVANVDYTRLDGSVVRLPATSIAHRNADGLVDDMQIFVDMTPVVMPDAS